MKELVGPIREGKRNFRCLGSGKCSKCDQESDMLWTFSADGKTIAENICGDCAIELLSSEKDFEVSE